MSEKHPVITIDGPSGTGKGTIAQLLARTLKWKVLDSGAVYRSLALAASWYKINKEDDLALAQLANTLNLKFDQKKNNIRIILEKKEVTNLIRTEFCGQLASYIATKPLVRKALLDYQRSFSTSLGLVADGRDMGTVVFPAAMLKIYLDASNQVRANRRYLQLKEKGISVSLSEVFEELIQRDDRDRNRLVAPLIASPDSIIINTDEIEIDLLLKMVLQLAQSRLNCVLV